MVWCWPCLAGCTITSYREMGMTVVCPIPCVYSQGYIGTISCVYVCVCVCVCVCVEEWTQSLLHSEQCSTTELHP
jgi:hypothetical protein